MKSAIVSRNITGRLIPLMNAMLRTENGDVFDEGRLVLLLLVGGFMNRVTEDSLCAAPLAEKPRTPRRLETDEFRAGSPADGAVHLLREERDSFPISAAPSIATH